MTFQSYLKRRFPGISGYAKPFMVAAVLVACEPLTPLPPSNCDGIPSCSTLSFTLTVQQAGNIGPDSTGIYKIDRPGFRLDIQPGSVPEQFACRSAGRGGFAYATSCALCSGAYIKADSLIFSTDILTFFGDTLKAGYNFAPQVNLPGFKGNGTWWYIDSILPVRFRDSLFEIRFTGKADSANKSGRLTIHITSPALLMP